MGYRDVKCADFGAGQNFRYSRGHSTAYDPAMLRDRRAIPGLLGLPLIAVGTALDATAFVGYVLLTYYSGQPHEAGYSYFEMVLWPNLCWVSAGCGTLVILIGAAIWASRTNPWKLLLTGSAIMGVGWLVSRISPVNREYSYEAFLALAWVSIGLIGPWFLILGGIRFVSKSNS